MGEDRTHTGEHGTKNHTKKVDDAGSCERSNRNARILAGSTCLTGGGYGS